MVPILFYLWGCIPELQPGCIDMTNASSTYLGILGGAITGAIVSWWVYNRQKKISNSQDYILGRIKDLEESHDSILKKLEKFDDKHESSFNAINDLNEKLDSFLKKRDEN